MSLNVKSIKDIYLIAICGTGMTALAGMLKAKGYQVLGSDQHIYPPMSTKLEELGIPVYEGFSEKHLEPAPDLVVIGNSMSRGNPEVETVLERKLNYISLPQALKEFFIRGHYSCVVAGTHGKTTISSLLAWVLENAGKNPSFFIGGIPENFGNGFKLGNGEIFVLEGDEYDTAFFDKASKFIHYLPDLVILNNVEFDHADIFRNIEDIEITFKRLINLIPRNGYLIACWDDPLVQKLSKHAFSHVISFGLNAGAEWQARNILNGENYTEFDVFHKQDFVDRFKIPLHGQHMVCNSLGVIAASQVLDLTISDIKPGFLSFKNVRRRLQFKGEVNHIKIFDDFAHHPTEVKATLSGLRDRYPDNRIWAIFEPRTATSKRNIFAEKYSTAFEGADRVILTPLYLPEKVAKEDRLSIEELSIKLNKNKIPTYVKSANSEMLSFLSDNLEPNDIVLFMSNGDFNQIPNKLLNTI